ncbi:hypothetical protein MTP10_20870 [Nonomuraea sp. 3-1Str]|uniref:hypothetical protein n=1 Tax=Nonomuraea sp. 3-1Str TaxID=2929801 RepID=UPI0028572511|nr:hypothetical protein [Nonomuraea sp. 3-1Str]MDR8411173.1 hypothetical protein [Nonomuraea sp. 3-1Str]
MNPPGSWCERPEPQAPSCELPSPWSKPERPADWCDVPESPIKSPIVSVIGHFLKAAARR